MTDTIIWRFEHIESGKGPIEHLFKSGKGKEAIKYYIEHSCPGYGNSALDEKWTEILEEQDGIAYGPKSRLWFFGGRSPEIIASCFCDFEGLAELGFRLRIYSAKETYTGHDGQVIFKKNEAALIRDVCPTSIKRFDKGKKEKNFIAPQKIAA